MILNLLAKIGRKTINTLTLMGKSGLFLTKIIFHQPDGGKGFWLVIRQLHYVGTLSLLIIMVSGLFVGMVLALQGYSTLIKFGAEQSLGPLVSLSLVRELGPVVAALLFAGRAGSALAAEIGLMKATEQLSSMSMMAVDPLKRIIAPRFWAGVISMPILAAIFSCVGISGGYMVGVEWLGLDEGAFWGNMQSNVDWYDDVVNGIIKSAVFGFLITWIAVFQGYTCVPTSEGVSRATTNTVVYSSLIILFADFVLTTIMFGL